MSITSYDTRFGEGDRQSRRTAKGKEKEAGFLACALPGIVPRCCWFASCSAAPSQAGSVTPVADPWIGSVFFNVSFRVAVPKGPARKHNDSDDKRD